MTVDSSAAPGRFFHGWVIVAAAFGVMFIGFGIAYTFAAFFDALAAEFDAQRADVSLVFGIAGFLYFGLGALSGPLADRFGPRGVIVAGMVVMAAGLLLAARAQALWQVYLTYGLCIGLGVGLMYVPSLGAVQRWFLRKRGFASGLAVSGIGVGTLVMPPLAAWLIERIGWRGTYELLGELALFIGVAVALLVEASPARRRMHPDGTSAPPPGGPAASGSSLREALASRPFWALSAAALLGSFGLFIPFVHLAAYATDHGLSQELSVGLIGLIGVGSIAGRFLLGGLADRLGRRRSFLLMFIGQSAMMLFWLGSTSGWSLAVFAILFGAFYGGFVALAPALAADYFGERSISGIIGVLYSSVAFGTLLGPPLAGWAYDRTQSYEVAIVASAVLTFVGAAILLMAPQPQSWRAARAAAVHSTG